MLQKYLNTSFILHTACPPPLPFSRFFVLSSHFFILSLTSRFPYPSPSPSVLVCVCVVLAGKTSVEWKRGPQPPAAGDVASPEALVGIIEELMNTVRLAGRWQRVLFT